MGSLMAQMLRFCEEVARHWHCARSALADWEIDDLARLGQVSNLSLARLSCLHPNSSRMQWRSEKIRAVVRI